MVKKPRTVISRPLVHVVIRSGLRRTVLECHLLCPPRGIQARPKGSNGAISPAPWTSPPWCFRPMTSARSAAGEAARYCAAPVARRFALADPRLRIALQTPSGFRASIEMETCGGQVKLTRSKISQPTVSRLFSKKQILPDVGVTGPRNSWIVVVLPALLGLSNPRISPRSIGKETPSTAVNPPNTPPPADQWPAAAPVLRRSR